MIINMDTKKSRKKAHNEQVRARILAAAGLAFRAHGYDGVGLNDLMAGAGLTRGAFYAHFKSKEALFVEVMRAQHPILRKLQDRTGDADALWQGLTDIFTSYLKFEHREEIWRGCSIAMLTHDVARSSVEARQAYERVIGLIEAEVIRGQGIPAGDPPVTAAVTLAFGAVAQAKAAESTIRQQSVLAAAATVFFALLTEARAR